MFWGPVPHAGVLKVGALGVGSKPFTPQGEAGSWKIPPDCMVLCQGWGLLCESVSAFPIHFNVGDVGIFSFAQCVGVVQLVSRSPAERIAPCVAIDRYVRCPWEEVSSGASCVTILYCTGKLLMALIIILIFCYMDHKDRAFFLQDFVSFPSFILLYISQ